MTTQPKPDVATIHPLFENILKMHNIIPVIMTPETSLEEAARGYAESDLPSFDTVELTDHDVVAIKYEAFKAGAGWSAHASREKELEAEIKRLKEELEATIQFYRTNP